MQILFIAKGALDSLMLIYLNIYSNKTQNKTEDEVRYS